MSAPLPPPPHTHPLHSLIFTGPCLAVVFPFQVLPGDDGLGHDWHRNVWDTCMPPAFPNSFPITVEGHGLRFTVKFLGCGDASFPRFPQFPNFPEIAVAGHDG